jgi:hypothetical protein
MEFVVILFLAVFGGCIVGEKISANKCRGDIIDIYYPPDQEYMAYHKDCPYTKTRLNCVRCQMHDVSRNHYEKYIYNNFTKYNMRVMFPKRTDTRNLYPPRDNLGFRGG